MSHLVRFVLVLHNHQPIGNFTGVMEQAYQESYAPFLDVFERYPTIPIALHTSGSLMEWLEESHPEYLDRLAGLVAAGRIEIIGGAYYEPILTMIPRRDRIGQIQRYTHWLERRLGATVRGAWVPERVWEQSLASDLSTAGIQYTVLDDFHFKNAALTQEELHGYYVTEDDGLILAVFPGSERLRYTIPFASPEETIRYLREMGELHPGSVVVFGDDGEKFGTWPGTHKHCYEEGWLSRFFDLLVANQSWLKLTTLAEAVDNVPPTGKIYLPNSSYREMTEWALPATRLVEYEHMVHDLEQDPRAPLLSQYIKGGFWRNFKLKYPESDEMYTRMMMVSNRLHDAIASGHDPDLLDAARAELYRAQCNCSYWHGAFGGIYLPHLRNAVYQHLIAADNVLERASARPPQWIEGVASDFNLDGRQEVFLANDRLASIMSPFQGGMLYELDVRSICHNLLATMTRRPEAYHERVLGGERESNGECASIHDRVVFKQEGLDRRIQYDLHPRKSLLDHFYDNDATLHAVAAGQAQERGDFLLSPYEARLRRNPNRIQVQLTRHGNAWGHPLKITKGITLEEGSSTLEIGYLIENLPQNAMFHFSVEFNFAGMPAGLEDRYFRNEAGARLGHLGSKLDLHNTHDIHLYDDYLGLDVSLGISQASNIWTFPVETVSQSEGGFELVHQSVVVQPHWLIHGDAHGRWSVSMRLTADTSTAERRRQVHETREFAGVVGKG